MPPATGVSHWGLKLCETTNEERALDPYGISKHEAELGLRQLATETGMKVVIIRPPLVYGPGVKANFQSMMRWLQHGIPLPFGANIDISKARTLLG